MTERPNILLLMSDQQRWDLVNFLRENFGRPLDRADEAGGS